mgnify:CR=1 FL=1
MNILEIALTNWQPYRGAGKDAKKVFSEGKNGEKNVIVYGQNTHGKTALWQAIRFALYGRVAKRLAGVEEGSWKPLVASESSEEPLLNVTAHEMGVYDFGVRLRFTHEGAEYSLERSYSEKRNVAIPRRDDQMEQTFTIRNETTGSYIQEKQKFINDILPENLARFFMFDGEKLMEFRKLFTDTKDVHLRNYIEAILRFPVLTDGLLDFEKMDKSLKGQITKHAKKHRKGEEALEELTAVQSDLDVEREVLDDYKNDLEEYKSNLGIVNEWLKNNEEGQKVLDQQDTFKSQEDEAKDEIKSIEEQMSKSLSGTWRAIITKKIDSRLKELGSDLTRQQIQTQRMGEIELELGHLENKLQGRRCSACDTELEKPGRKKEAKLMDSKVALEKEHKELDEARLDPSPNWLWTRQTALTKIRNDLKLDILIDLERSLLKWKSKLRTAKQNFEKASKNISPNRAKDLAEKTLEQTDLHKKIGRVEGQIEEKDRTIKNLELDQEKLQDILGTGGGAKPPAYRKDEIRKALFENLAEAWESVIDTHRENQRERVEKEASKVFLGLSNKSSEYKKLRISESFQLSIIDKKNKPNAGSPGQWGLIAYSILDALTTCSGIEFPLVIDTPGRSIDDDHLRKTLAYLLESDKQVFVFPEGSELLPDDGDKLFGHRCAATFQLAQNKDDASITDIVKRVDNLRN